MYEYNYYPDYALKLHRERRMLILYMNENNSEFYKKAIECSFCKRTIYARIKEWYYDRKRKSQDQKA